LFFPIIQSIHILGLSLLVGIAITDLCNLGFLRVSANLAPWTSTGLVTMGITGPLLFLWDWHRYLNNPAFLVKMVILSIALVTQFTLNRGRHQKLAAILSLALWSCVVVADRAIADFDIRGV
jgi:hypothetical protein